MLVIVSGLPNLASAFVRTAALAPPPPQSLRPCDSNDRQIASLDNIVGPRPRKRERANAAGGSPTAASTAATGREGGKGKGGAERERNGSGEAAGAFRRPCLVGAPPRGVLRGGCR